jgi:hypothetical protein
MDDGTELVAGPGDITSLPSGHDAWVVGDEPAWSWTGTGQATTPRVADGPPMPGLEGDSEAALGDEER